MAIKQIVPIFITLQGDGTSTAFVYAIQNLYQANVGGSIPFGAQGVIPSSAVANNPPVPVTSVAVDANGNVTITLTTALGNNVQATFEIDLIYNSGAASSSSPTTASLVTLTGVSTVTVSGTTAVSGTVAVTQSTSPWVVSLASTTVTGTVAVTQSGTWTNRIVGNAGSTLDASVTANTAPTNGVAVLGVSPSVTPTLSGGQSAALQLSVAGRLNTGVQEWAGTQLGTPTNFGTTPGAVVSGSVNASLFAGTTALSQTGGSLNVNVTGGGGGGTQYTTGTAVASPIGTAALGWDGTDVRVLSTNSSGALNVLLTSTTVTGTVTVAGNKTNNNAAPGATNVGVLPAMVGPSDTTFPTYTAGDQVAVVTDLSGNTNVDVQYWGGVDLGAATNFGTTPGAVVVPGVNASLFIGTVAAVAAASGVLKVGISGATGATVDTTIGASAAAANAVQIAGVYTSAGITLTNGEAAALQVDSHGSLLVELSPNNPTSNMTGTVPGTAPGYTTIVGGIYNSTAPAATTGQTLPFQSDTTGSHYINQEGRKATYRACAVAYALLASATAPCIYVTGSSTKTVRITKIRFSASAGTGTVCDVTLRRFTALSGGGFGTGNITTSELDTPNPGSTATVHATTSLITTVTGATVLACERYEIVTPAATTLPGLIEWNFGIANDQALVLRGTADFVGITVSAIGTTPAADVWIEWTEE